MNNQDPLKNIEICVQNSKTESTQSFQNKIKRKFADKYSVSQNCFYLQAFQKMMQSFFSKSKRKTNNLAAIILKDIKFQEDNENMEKLYKPYEIKTELSELFEYYKYYTQQPACLLKNQFAIMFDHQERKKAYLYNELKKLLEITASIKSKQSPEKNQKKKITCENILTFLHHSKSKLQRDDSSKDQSICFQEISENLNIMFGFSKIKTISKIDKTYKFMVHHNFQRPKKSSEFLAQQKLKTMLESTSISSKNIIMKKKDGEKSHKRYGTSELYQSPSFKIIKKKKNIRKSLDQIQNLESDKVLQKHEAKLVIQEDKNNPKSKESQKKMKINLKTGIVKMKRKVWKEKENMVNLISRERRKKR